MLNFVLAKIWDFECALNNTISNSVSERSNVGRSTNLRWSYSFSPNHLLTFDSKEWGSRIWLETWTLNYPPQLMQRHKDEPCPSQQLFDCETVTQTNTWHQHCKRNPRTHQEPQPPVLAAQFAVNLAFFLPVLWCTQSPLLILQHLNNKDETLWIGENKEVYQNVCLNQQTGELSLKCCHTMRAHEKGKESVSDSKHHPGNNTWDCCRHHHRMRFRPHDALLLLWCDWTCFFVSSQTCQTIECIKNHQLWKPTALEVPHFPMIGWGVRQIPWQQTNRSARNRASSLICSWWIDANTTQTCQSQRIQIKKREQRVPIFAMNVPTSQH